MTLTDRKIILRRVVAGIVASICVGAMILSYSALYQYGVLAKVTPRWAWVWPITIDLTLICGALFTLIDELDHLTRWQRLPAWAVTLIGVTYSTWVQMLLAPPNVGGARLVHASPPVVVAITWWLFMRVMRREIAARKRAGIGSAQTATRSARIDTGTSVVADAPGATGATASATEDLTTPYGGSESGVVVGDEISDALVVAHGATRAREAARAVSARHRADTGRRRATTDTRAEAREIFERADARGEKLTGGELAAALGGKIKVAMANRYLKEFRDEIKRGVPVS